MGNVSLENIPFHFDKYEVHKAALFRLLQTCRLGEVTFSDLLPLLLLLLLEQQQIMMMMIFCFPITQVSIGRNPQW